ncbi:MAG: aromatic ring-hydroxylating dioxygenase subunit alpha [Bryobacteraceae bacterium]
MSTVSKTLPARYYTDAGLFRREIDYFFFEGWICAGRADSIPQAGDYFLREIAGESIIVVRGNSGSVEAFYNVCRHRGTRICSAPEGSFGGRIQCPYHGWTYGLDGRLLGAPHMGPPEIFQRSDYPLHKLQADLWDGHIFINAGSHPDPLAAQLADLPARFAGWRMAELRLHKRITYDVHANWKLIVANYNECLHCPLLHPALNRLTDYIGSDNEAPQPTYIGGSMGFRAGAETMSIDGAKPDFVADDAIEFWDVTNREDWHIVELSQAGIQSRAYTPGPYSSREDLLAAFDQVVIQRDSAGNSDGC